MPRKQEAIRTQAFVHVGDRLVNMEDLSKSQRNYVASVLQVTMLNAAYQGQAEFTMEALPSADDVFGESK